MGGIFDLFKGEKAKQREFEEEQEVSYIRSRKEVEHEVFDALMREFKIDDSTGLKKTVSAQDPPTAILRNNMQAFSMWYRLPIRGESKAGHIVDFALFRGTHRIAEKAHPDVVIECRQLDLGHSNRIDPRIVKDIVGLSIDVLPAMAILATNRELSPYAMELAAAYGIQIVNTQNESASKELFELITSDRQTTRERLMRNLEHALGKIDSLVVKRAATPWGRKIIEEKQERLKDRVLKELAKAKATPTHLARALHTHEEFILNELYALERERRARVIERTTTDQMENVWGIIPAAKK